MSGDRPTPGPDHEAVWAPFRQRRFAALWSAWLIANLCIWMADVAASWLMTSLTDSKFMVAMIQTASSLPVFLLALPAGTLADRMNRRDGFLAAQLWSVIVLAGLAGLAWAGRLSPPVLLTLMFASSMATALRWPMFNALFPDVVAREQMAQAVSLNGIAVNASRLLGPILAGWVLAAWGGSVVFGLCVGLSLVAAWLVASADYRAPDRVPSPEPWPRAMHAALDHARHSARLRAVLLRSFLFFATTMALLGLLPPLARHLGGDAQVYAMLFSCLGAGAVSAGLLVQPLRRGLGYQGLVTWGTGMIGLCLLAVALSSITWLSAILLFLAGAAWMMGGNTLNYASQMALPDSLRARGMSILLMVVMGGGATGAACFGALADGIGLRQSLLTLGGMNVLLALILRKRLPVT